jgi:N-acetylglucosaminyl-diphospho-decaprenol L-rhamnosyltransferase
MSKARLPLSVIVPTRNTCAMTLRCLAALDAAGARAAEVIVVDDGGRDETGEAVRSRFPFARVVTRATSGGFTAAVNEAWPLVTRDIVLLLNSDTEVDADALTGFVSAFAADSQLGVAGASLRYANGRQQWSAGREPSARWLFALASGAAAAIGSVPGWRLLRRESQARARGDSAGGGGTGVGADWVPATAMAVRREVHAAIGVFDPAFAMYAQDLDYCVRARAAGWRVAQLPDVGVIHLLGATIGGTVGARQDPRALFVDLSRWIEKRHSRAPARARRLQRTLTAGVAARIATRQAVRALVWSERRAAWDRETSRYREAAAALAHARVSTRDADPR